MVYNYVYKRAGDVMQLEVKKRRHYEWYLWIILIPLDIYCFTIVKGIWKPILNSMYSAEHGMIAISAQNTVIVASALLACYSIIQLNAISAVIYGLFYSNAWGGKLKYFLFGIFLKFFPNSGEVGRAYMEAISSIISFFVFCFVAGFFNVVFSKTLSAIRRSMEAVVKNESQTKMSTKKLVANKDNFKHLIGVDEAVKTIKDALEIPLLYPEKAKKFGVKPLKGILLYGPPGCGKTSLARAAAGYFNCAFYSIKAGDLLDKYVGESERKIKELFEGARASAPAIIFIDEIDHIGRRRDGGAMNRPSDIVLQPLLAEMDGFVENDKVVVMAATNRPDVLDEALLRPGRFDRLIEIPLPDNKGRRELFRHYLTGKPLEKEIDYDRLAELTDGCSPAHIEQICNQAGILALNREIAEKKNAYITMNDLLEGIKKVVGSGSKNCFRNDGYYPTVN